jgi:hypothetical protein
MDESSNVFNAMDDVSDLAIGAKNRGIDRAPIALLHLAALSANIVSLHVHGVGNPMAHGAFKGAAQSVHAREIVGIVVEDVEEMLANEVFATHLDGAQIIIGRGEDEEVRIDDQIKRWRFFKQSPIVGADSHTKLSLHRKCAFR